MKRGIYYRESNNSIYLYNGKSLSYLHDDMFVFMKSIWSVSEARRMKIHLELIWEF